VVAGVEVVAWEVEAWEEEAWEEEAWDGEGAEEDADGSACASRSSPHASSVCSPSASSALGDIRC